MFYVMHLSHFLSENPQNIYVVKFTPFQRVRQMIVKTHQLHAHEYNQIIYNQIQGSVSLQIM